MTIIDDEKRSRVYKRDGYICRYPRCFSGNIHLAHGIAKTKANNRMIIRKVRDLFNIEINEDQSWQIINSDENLYTSCLKHNDSFNFGNKPALVEYFIKKLYERTLFENLY